MRSLAKEKWSPNIWQSRDDCSTHTHPGSGLLKCEQFCTADLMFRGLEMLVLERRGLTEGHLQHATVFLHGVQLWEDSRCPSQRDLNGDVHNRTEELKSSEMVTFLSRMDTF